MQSVLIVDDDLVLSEALSVAMQRPGREVIVCSDIESAELVVERQRVTCVVSDVRLTSPFRFEGLDFIRHVRQHSPESAFVLMTGAPSEELIREGLARGATVVLTKPFEVAEIEQLIGEPEADDEPRTVWMPSVEEIVGSGALVPSFQPIVDLAAGDAPFGFESLARFQTAGILRFPDALFGYATRKGRIAELELACIRSTFAHCAPLAATGARIFINIHPAVIGSGELLRTLEQCLASSGVPPARVILEITEQQPLAGDVANECAALRARGYSFALDDVGVAYSHLSHIGDIRPAYLKISQEFGGSYELDETRSKIVRSVMALAREFGGELVLEGVESASTRDAAREQGIRFAQGYFFGRPRPAAEHLAPRS